MDPRNLSNEALDNRMIKRAEEERKGIVDFLVDLLEVERRGRHVALGYASLYLYVRKHLKYCESTAWRRCEVLVLIVVFPVVLEWLMEGRTNVETLLQLRHVMNEDNHLELLARCEGMGRREVDVLIESIRAPQPEWRWAPTPPVPPEDVPPLTSERAPTFTEGWVPAPMEMFPVAPKLMRRVEMTEEDWELVQDCKSLLSHAMPDAQPSDVVREALKQLKQRLETKKHGAEKPRKAKAPKDPHTVPKAVARAVWERDGGRCTFVGETGVRCNSRHKLQNHHIDPKGPSTVDNVTLHCRQHNFHRAEVDYGVEHMKQFRTHSPGAAFTGRTQWRGG